MHDPTQPSSYSSYSSRESNQAREGGDKEFMDELGYRFPYGRALLEPVPDIARTFGVRLAWQRGKVIVPVFETTPLRPIAQVSLNGQKFPVFLSQHARKKRDRVALAGKRKTARPDRCALRFVALVEGREDKLRWRWRIGATAAAMAQLTPQETPPAPDEVTLYLPFSSPKARVLYSPGISDGLAIWLNDIVVTICVGAFSGIISDDIRPHLEVTEKGVQLTLRGICLGGAGVALDWETWLSPARTEAEAHAALDRHLAHAADRAQETGDYEPNLLTRLGAENEAALMAENRVDKKGMDRLLFRATPGSSEVHSVGEGTDTALAVTALLGRYYQSGDDALRRRARLLARGVCEFQITAEESAHWGAFWDIQRKKAFSDAHGDPTVGIATTARMARGLHVAHAHFKTEILSRSALAGAQWLMLKMDRLGHIPAARFHKEGPPMSGAEYPWIMAETLLPLVETFRVTGNEVFLKASHRVTNALREGITDATLPFDQASSEQLASAIEGVLQVSREYEKNDLLALAQQMAIGLRLRRQPDGSLREPPSVFPLSPLAATLAGARAGVALARVDDDALWPLFALRALRAAGKQAASLESNRIADQTALCALPTALLLAIASRAKNCVSDFDLVSIKRGWQTFKPDPVTREYVSVTDESGQPVDHLALVCPVSTQVLIAVLGAPHAEKVNIIKNKRIPYVKNLLDGDYDQCARVLPLGDGSEATIGVFLLDT